MLEGCPPSIPYASWQFTYMDNSDKQDAPSGRKSYLGHCSFREAHGAQPDGTGGRRMGSLQNVLGKHKVWFGKCCTFSCPLSSCGYSAPELTKLYLSCYILGPALSCSKSCFLSCKVQSVQQDWGHSPSLLSENSGWTWQKVSAVMETHGSLCCWDYRPCFRVQPCYTHTHRDLSHPSSPKAWQYSWMLQKTLFCYQQPSCPFFKRTASAPPASTTEAYRISLHCSSYVVQTQCEAPLPWDTCTHFNTWQFGLAGKTLSTF